MTLRDQPDFHARRNVLEKELDISLTTIGSVFSDEIADVHCENLIGSITIPVGVVGPVQINGEYIKNARYIPLATTEGALVASVQRGCKAINESQGVTVRTQLVGATRGPVFITAGIVQSLALQKWIQGSHSEIARIAESTSNHLKLLDIKVRVMGKQVYVKFAYDTEDAMGMNMVTIATEKIAEYIEKETQASCIAVAGNYDIDKKPSWLTMSEGRGKMGWAEITISKDVVKSVLKTTPEKIIHIVKEKCWGGSIMSGAMGHNAHYANIVAAFYAATGQDVAHTVEGSHGITNADVMENGDLYFSIHLPAIMLGTVGGGTKLKTQKEARSITKTVKSSELAEILMAAVLAGELSLIASLAEHSLACAHTRLGR